MSYDLTVRVTIVGRASRRWRGAKSPAEAERLNQALSEARAQNLRKPVEDILRKELPGVKIEAPAQGLGSQHGFPLTGEDNAAIDRSVVVAIELTTTLRGTRTEFRPTKIYAPSKYWTLKVVSLVGGSGGLKVVHMRVKVRSSTTGRELTMAGTLAGGALPSPKKPFDLDNRKNLDQPIGQEVTFTTPEAEGFDYFVGSENGQWVRLVNAGVGFIRKRETTFLQFTSLDTEPGSLVFDYSKGWSLPKVDLGVVTGILKVEGAVPSDYIDGSTMVTVPTQDVHRSHDGLLVSFPTEKAGWTDLTAKDRERLTDFVTSKARNIAALADLGFKVAP
ncbi:MAG: hypothetical protein AB7H90_04595 [Alphaproteobacteria bacterium]